MHSYLCAIVIPWPIYTRLNYVGPVPFYASLVPYPYGLMWESNAHF